MHTGIASCRMWSRATIGAIRHNRSRKRNYLKRDSGGWIPLELIPDYFQENHTSDMGPIEEYVKIHRGLFGSMEDARMGAVIACLAGEKGGRISLLMAVMTTSRTSTSEPEVRQFLRPVALRACAGHSLDGQLPSTVALQHEVDQGTSSQDPRPLPRHHRNCMGPDFARRA